MPSSTLDRSRTRAKPSDWVVIVPGHEPIDRPDPAELAAPAAARPAIRPGLTAPFRPLARPAARPIVLPGAVRRFLPRLGLMAAFLAVLGFLLGPHPLLTLGLTSPQFVAYQGDSAEQVRFVLNDGWSQTAAVPGALLMDWREGRPQPALRLTLGNPAAEPEVAKLTVDGNSIKEIRYPAAWPGVDAEIRALPGGWSANFIVQPGVDPSVIELEYVGATELTVDAAGRLHVRTPEGLWIDGTPESWQIGPSGREPVESRYEPRGGGKFGFVVGPYDPSRPLTVDPPSERVS
jgi:hypothetical protein